MRPGGDIPGNDPRWEVWARPWGQYFRTPRTVGEFTLTAQRLELDGLHVLNIVAWMENEFLLHMENGAWSLTPIGEEWAPTATTDPWAGLAIRVDPNMRGRVYGRWEFVCKVKGERPTRWWMRCKCPRHTERAVLAANVKEGLSRSCGCIREKGRLRPRTVTEAQIKEAAERYAHGETFPAIARSFGKVNPNGLRELCLRRGLITVDPRGNSPERLREHMLAVRHA